MTITMVPLSMTGLCRNGAQRNSGQLYHACLPADAGGWGRALCGTRPGKHGNGWSQHQGSKVTCRRCLMALLSLLSLEHLGIRQGLRQVLLVASWVAGNAIFTLEILRYGQKGCRRSYPLVGHAVEMARRMVFYPNDCPREVLLDYLNEFPDCVKGLSAERVREAVSAVGTSNGWFAY